MICRTLAQITSLIFALAAIGSLANAGNTKAQWTEFQKNPRAFMDRLPPKRDPSGVVIPDENLFSKQDAKTGDFIDKKSGYRIGSSNGLTSPICNANGVCLKDVRTGRAIAQAQVTDFLDMQEFKQKGLTPILTLQEMEAKKLMTSYLDETPWSDTYWPIFQGIIGARYNSPEYRGLDTKWKAYSGFVHDAKLSLKIVYTGVLNGGQPSDLDDLSPSEKYDLLIGDLSGPTGTYDSGYLTPPMWSEGEQYDKKSGSVETWMGICHGWAPASFMVPRPRNAINVTAADGKTSVPFFPSDIKGLSSYLWAKAPVSSSFMGGRCDEKNPKQDPATGRILDDKCFDTNPGNWHTAIVNQIGQARRSFVLDATYDYEVWNQPAYGYSYTYFNPQTGEEATNLQDATVLFKDFTNDKFKKFRSTDVAAVVGIRMDLKYVVEVYPTHSTTNSPADDLTRSVNYMYDLELNGAGQIIGGEWYTNKHPDFMWLPHFNSRVVSYGDARLTQTSTQGAWQPGQALPQFWRDIAIATATRYGQPLATILEQLVQQSRE